jgi:hypothetical protein
MGFHCGRKPPNQELCGGMTNIDIHAVVSTTYDSWCSTISVPAEALPPYAPAHVAWHKQLGGVPRHAKFQLKMTYRKQRGRQTFVDRGTYPLVAA